MPVTVVGASVTTDGATAPDSTVVFQPAELTVSKDERVIVVRSVTVDVIVCVVWMVVVMAGDAKLKLVVVYAGGATVAVSNVTVSAENGWGTRYTVAVPVVRAAPLAGEMPLIQLVVSETTA